MSIPDIDTKILWGRAAGRCSKPGCFEDLTRIIPQGTFNIGEMAHIIAQSPGGPRGQTSGGNNTYDNLILLCPTHHREIDKAPSGAFPTAMLHDWKARHEARISSLGKEVVFPDFVALKKAVAIKLIENKDLWASLGPKSTAAESDPSSNLSELWTLRKLDTIIPNNRTIINYIEKHLSLLDADTMSDFYSFKTHAEAFERHQYNKMDNYPYFPAKFAKDFEIG